MSHQDLEARIARLEQRVARWQLVAGGAALVMTAAVVNACAAKQQPIERLELVDKDGTRLQLDAHGLELTRGDAKVTLDLDGLVLAAKDVESKLQPGALALLGCPNPPSPCTEKTRMSFVDGALVLARGELETKLAPGKLDLEHGDREIEADVTDAKDVWLKGSANGGRSTMLVWLNSNVAVVGTSLFVDEGKPWGARIGVDRQGASATVEARGAEKKLELARK